MPIPDGLWRRLANLDARCDLEMRRTGTEPAGARFDGSRNYKRMWRVRLWQRGDETWAMTVEAASLLQALEAAVTQAEKRGWAASP